MSDFFAIVSNVKIIKQIIGQPPNFGRNILFEKLTDVFPPVDVIAKNGVVHIFADVPGISCNDISVYLYNDLVVIEGIKTENKIYIDYRFIRIERRLPSFKRVFKLPFVPKECEAYLRDGVLHVILED